MIGDLIDRVSGAIVTLDNLEHQMHSGRDFTIARPLTLPAGNDDEILITTPDSDIRIHFNFSIVSDSTVTVSLYEVSTLTAGTPLVPINRNRNSDETSVLTVAHTPSGSGDGNLLYQWVAAALTPVGGGASSNARNEFILKQNTVYLLRAAGAQNDVVNVVLDWYEHADVI